MSDSPPVACEGLQTVFVVFSAVASPYSVHRTLEGAQRTVVEGLNRRGFEWRFFEEWKDVSDPWDDTQTWRARWETPELTGTQTVWIRQMPVQV